MSFNSFYERLINLCTPNPACIPDYKERSLIATKTKIQLLIYAFALLTLIIQLLQGNINLPSHLIRILQASGLLCLLLTCCRSHLHIYYIILTIIVSFTAILVTIKGETYFPLSAGFLGSILLYIITDTWHYYTIAGLIHLCNFHFFLKKNMEITIIQVGPKQFCHKLIEAATYQLVVMIFVLGPLHFALKKLNQDLRESKVEVEGSLSHYKTFLFSFSHEVRNPINILLGSLEMALQERLPTSALEMIQTAKISGELLLQLINNVLDIGKAEVGKLEIVPMPTRVHELLIRMWNLCSELIKKKKLCGYLKIDVNLPSTLELDPDRLNQVLLNLLGNAIKFTQRGLVNLTIEWLEDCEKATDQCFEPLPFNQDEEGIFDKNECLSTLGYSTGSEPGFINNFYILTHLQKRVSQKMNFSGVNSELSEKKGVLKVIVKDQGCGMSKEAMKGLFKKFYQCSKEASQRKRGTGLGLYITKDICESMGGEVRVYSEEERGTVFIACVPCKMVSGDGY